ncbi:MAG: polysaccharide biosynthesis tyrosine autokinase [Muribaculaceae bacterium]|nr:polysaccharide biosynthesis tyrosine autokinase [Muribaculaceae bacterium]
MADERTKESNTSVKSEGFEEGFDVMGLLMDYLSHWKWFVICGVIALACAYYHYATIIPTYSVSASIYLSDDKNTTTKAMAMTGSLVDTKNFIDQTELEILRSRNSVIKIVDSLNLAYSYAYKGRFRNRPIYGSNPVQIRLDSVSLQNLRSPIKAEIDRTGDNKFSIKITTYYSGEKEEKTFKDASLPLEVELSQGTLTISNTPGAGVLNNTLYATVNNRMAVASRISGSLNLAFNYNAYNIINITCRTPVIEEGVDIVNALIDFYNRQIIEDKNKSAIQTEAFILDRLVMISGELRDVENRLQEYRQKHQIVDLGAQASMNLSQKTSYQTELTNIDAELRMLDDIERMVSTADIYETLPSAVSDNTIGSMIEAYNRKVIQLNRTLQGSTPDNPLVTKMQEDLSHDKYRLLSNIASTRKVINTRRGTIQSLENRSEGQLSSLPPIDKGLQEIFREQQVKVNIYTFLLQRREEIALQKTLATNTARLIDNPVGSGPVAPDRNQILLMGLIIGLLIPAVIIFLRRLLFPIFKDQEELERITSVPILGEICRVGASKGSDEVIIGENVSTPAAELFRLLRNNIGFTKHGTENQVILITSAVSGEGKTFVAVNLAMTYALTGKKTLVIGLDIRRPALAHRFHLNNQRGVTTYLSGQEKDINKLVHQSTINPNLYILPAGPVAPNPNELLMAPTMDEMMKQLREEFDYIIIDSAPVGIVSDTFLILRNSDLQIFVTRANYSSRRGLRVLHQAIKQDKFSKVYIVLNGVDMGSGSYLYRRYGQYRTYGAQGRSYGYGYNSEKNKSGHHHHHHNSEEKKD